MATVDYYKELPMLQGMADVVAALEYGSIEQLLRGPAQAGTVLGPARTQPDQRIAAIGCPHPRPNPRHAA
jgi:hypothetical protein